MFAILQKYDFSSKSQQPGLDTRLQLVVCDTAKVRFFKQITTMICREFAPILLFAILQKYDFSSKSQHTILFNRFTKVVCDTAKVRFFKQITTVRLPVMRSSTLFAILQKYDFSSKSQHEYSKYVSLKVVCDTAKVRFFKQITTTCHAGAVLVLLFAILQKYDFSSKSQQACAPPRSAHGCLRYCKSTIFQANHNLRRKQKRKIPVVCDTAKVRFFKQITTAVEYVP